MSTSYANGSAKALRALATAAFVFLMLVNVKIGFSDGRSGGLDILGLKLSVFTASAETTGTGMWYYTRTDLVECYILQPTCYVPICIDVSTFECQSSTSWSDCVAGVDPPRTDPSPPCAGFSESKGDLPLCGM